MFQVCSQGAWGRWLLCGVQGGHTGSSRVSGLPWAPVSAGLRPTQSTKQKMMWTEGLCGFIWVMVTVHVSENKNPACGSFHLAFAMETPRKQKLGLTRQAYNSCLAHDRPKFEFRVALEACAGLRSTLVLGSKIH